MPDLALAIYVAFFSVAFGWRAHGEAYLAYARRVGRFMPGIGYLA